MLIKSLSLNTFRYWESLDRVSIFIMILYLKVRFSRSMHRIIMVKITFQCRVHSCSRWVSNDCWFSDWVPPPPQLCILQTQQRSAPALPSSPFWCCLWCSPEPRQTIPIQLSHECMFWRFCPACTDNLDVELFRVNQSSATKYAETSLSKGSRTTIKDIPPSLRNCSLSSPYNGPKISLSIWNVQMFW